MLKSTLLSGEEAQIALKNGVNKIADAVGSTLGPTGRNVAIGRAVPTTGEVYEAIVVHDGVTVARSIALPDENENMGAGLLREAAQKQVDEVGDGTTVVMLLAQALVNECFKLMAQGANPMRLRRGLEDGIKRLQEEIKNEAMPCQSLKEMEFVAGISAQDRELGNMVAEMINKVGADGIITVEESKSSVTTSKLQEGMQIDRGFIDRGFITDYDRQEAVIENAHLFITDKPISSFGSLVPFLQKFVKRSKMIVFISPDISGEALAYLLQNKMEGKFLPLCITAPSMGEDQKAILEDIAILTGGKFLSEAAGYEFDKIEVDDLGFATSVVSTKKETTIAGGRSTKEAIQKRVEGIKTQLINEGSEFEIERLKGRLGRLTRGIGVIRVGGQTDIEMKERKERVKDAIEATRAAVREGIVPGGEIIYLHARKILTQSITDQILYCALHVPFTKLITNAGISEVDASLMLHGKSNKIGIDVMNEKAVDMVKARIVDPAAVSIHALANAVSVAVQIITSGYIINQYLPKEGK